MLNYFKILIKLFKNVILIKNINCLMTNDDICKAEYNRTEKLLNKIYLFKNNGGFWRANEWSCYLLFYSNKELEENQRLKLSHKTAKAGMDKSIISCGLKQSSFDKFIVNANETESKDPDNVKIFEVELKNYDIEITVDNYIDILKEFKSFVEISASNKTSNNSFNVSTKIPYNNPVSFTSIIKKIITYNLYNRETDDLISFIQELKEDSCSLF